MLNICHTRSFCHFRSQQRPPEANNTEDYVHRIGRTGRAGAKGYAVTFLCPSEDGGKISGIIQATDATGKIGTYWNTIKSSPVAGDFTSFYIPRLCKKLGISTAIMI